MVVGGPRQPGERIGIAAPAMCAGSTARLAIEPLVPAHAAGLHAALQHPDVGRFIGGPDVTTIDAVRARIERLAAGPGPARPDERWLNFAVRRNADGAIIGRLEATTYRTWGEIAYVFDPRWWGHGFASEATRWLMHHLAEQNVPELWAAVHPENHASKRLLLRTGFSPVREPARMLASFHPGDATFVWRDPAPAR